MSDTRMLNVVSDEVNVSGAYEIGDVLIEKKGLSYFDGARNTHRVVEILVDHEDAVFYRFDGTPYWRSGDDVAKSYNFVTATRCDSHKAAVDRETLLENGVDAITSQRDALISAARGAIDSLRYVNRNYINISGSGVLVQRIRALEAAIAMADKREK